MTASIKPERRSMGLRIIEYDDLKSKALIVCAMLLLAVVFLVASPALTYTEPRASINVAFTGLQLLTMLLTGNFTFQATAGKIAFQITLPPLVSIGFAALVLSLLALAIAVLVQGFARRRPARKLGLGIMGWGLLSIVWYLMLIGSSAVQAIERTGKVLSLYQVFDVGLSLLVAALLAALAGAVQFWLLPQRVRRVKKYWFIYLLLVVPTVCMVLFSFYPILMQTIISLKDFKIADGIWGSQWVGFKHFATIFTNAEILHVIGNSIYLSVIRIVATTLPPLLLAIFLFDMGRQRYRKVLQTVIYIPHFFSWIIIYSVFYALLANNGIFNQLLKLLTGDGNFYVDFLTNPNTIVPTMIVAQIWKEVGWGTILYLAALSNVDPTLYEAASIDGAGAMRKLWNITIPSILSVIIFLLILSMGSILSNGLEQILLFANLAVRDRVYTIELWVYNQGIGKLDYGISSAVGFAQSLIGLALVLGANWLSVKTVDRGLW